MLRAQQILEAAPPSQQLNRHYKFISAENITILSVSSDDFLHAFLEVADQQMWNYSSYLNKNKRLN